MQEFQKSVQNAFKMRSKRIKNDWPLLSGFPGGIAVLLALPMSASAEVLTAQRKNEQ
jgi:hypothetical protein